VNWSSLEEARERPHHTNPRIVNRLFEAQALLVGFRILTCGDYFSIVLGGFVPSATTTAVKHLLRQRSQIASEL
jgi:hypothetical protein